MRDLEDATGLHPGSLYRAYGDKQGLYACALSSYNERVVDQRVREHLHDALDARAGLTAFFTTTFTAIVDGIPGCLVTNSAIERDALDGPSRRGVAEGLAAIEDGLRAAVERMGAADDLADGVEPEAVAGPLLALYQGVLVLVRGGNR